MDTLPAEPRASDIHEPYEPRVVQLHPQSDASLVINSTTGCSTKFEVSSHILVVASPYFAQLCGPKFSEGQRILKGEHPDIILKEDEPDAMEIILSILHHKPCDEYETLEPGLLASVARHSDKYQCGKVLQPWASLWFLHVRSPIFRAEDGIVLAAAYFLESKANMRSISARIIRDSDINFDTEWSEYSVISSLPQRLRDSISHSISAVLEKIHVELQAVEGRLQDQKAAYKMSYRLCPLCGRLHPDNANQCHPCHNTLLHDALCTYGLRVAEFFACLRSVGLWPSVQPFRTLAPAVVAAKILQAKNGLKHRCQERLNCPLVLELETLSAKAESLVNDIRGINMEDFEKHGTD